MKTKSLLEQLKERRVIRATLIYVALLWVVLQAADLLAGAEIISEQLVRWLILIGVAGLPVTVLASWFLESPWKERRWTAVAGDLVIIVAVMAAAALFAWQQLFISFTRPTVAVLKIEVTDLQSDTDDLAAHLALRLRTALASRAELRVIELASSQHPKLNGNSIVEKAGLLGADYVLAGTVAQNNNMVRLNVQLFAGDGRLLHGNSFEDRFLDQAQLQNRVLAEFWMQLPLPEDGLAETRSLIADCRYPDTRNALLAIAAIDNGNDVDLEPYLKSYPEAGMLQLAQARRLFGTMTTMTPPQRPVTQRIAMQHLGKAAQLCPLTPDVPLLRLANTRESVSDAMLRQHPNSAELLRRASRQNSEPRRAEAFVNEARLLDPLGDW